MVRKAKKPRLPKLGRHSTGQGRVILNGQAFYVGPYGTAETQARYSELLTRWEAGGRQPLVPVPSVVQVVTVRAMLDRYVAWLDATKRYAKDGKPTSQRGLCSRTLDEFASHVGGVPACKLSAAMVRQFRDRLESETANARTTINKKVWHVRAALRWGRDREILTRDQWLDVAEIRPLTSQECGGRDRKRPKRAVTPEEVEQVAKAATPAVATLLRLQAATGMRPGEACKARWCDLSRDPVDVDGVPCVVYTVPSPKNAHHDREATTYALPPAVVAMLGKPTSPSDCLVLSPYGGGYDVGSYRNAVALACTKANVPPFSPHEVRHGFLSRAAKRFGVLAASRAANHSSTATTAGYLHSDRLDGYRVVLGLASNG